MSNAQAERPRFYQGQYLGPEDLGAAVDHARWARARHDLGAHAWGIAAGLELREVPALEGGVEVYVEPGYAVDGLGRPLLVTAALAVPAAALGRLSLGLTPGETSAAVPVWLRYVESETSEPPYGFAVCETDDPFARVAEGVEVLVGARTLADQRDPVVIDGVETDPTEALRTIETEAPLLCDASVPFQTFPEGDDRWWLIPLGYVRWEPGSPGRIIDSTEADRRDTRRFRRYLGVVAEGVYAADGLIRLRGRTVVPEAGAVSTADPCEPEWPRAQSAIDLQYDVDAGRVTPEELVWVEGHLRVAGDARLFGGELELRDEDGDTGGVPMRVHRVETNSFLDTGGNAISGRDLEVRIGTTGEDGRNRLVIGANTADPGEVGGRVVVQNDGRVGIGTLADPPTPLFSPLTVRGIGDAEELLSFEDAEGARRWHLNLKPGGAEGLNVAETGVADGRLFLAVGGNVGVSTTEPGAKLDVAEVPATAGAKWLRVGDGDDAGRFWVEYGAQLAPLMVMSDKDDPPRIRFQQTGAGTEEAPDFSSWIGHARSGSSDLAVMNGRLGVGTSAPQTPLHVDGGNDVKLAVADSGYLLVGFPEGLNLVMDHNEIMARDNGATSALHLQAEGGDVRVHHNVEVARRVVVRDSGRVGIGTDTPAEPLDVRGNVKLGSGGELFAVGGVDNLRAVAGRVDTAGTVVSGTGYSASWTSQGVCTVTFATPFAATPVVVATPVAGSGDDQLVTVSAITPGAFSVVTADVEHIPPDDPDVGTRESTEFTFIALGAR